MQTKRERFLNACRGLPVDATPVWFMRQAGRYLPGYQRWRREHAFAELLRRPDAAADITLEPLAALDVDALIVFSDILVLPEAMGMDLDFPDSGPGFAAPLRDAGAVEALRDPDPERDLGYVLETIRAVVAGAGPDVPVIGFAGAPLTLALFMIEGQVGRQFELARRFLYEQPQAAARLLDRLADALVPYLLAQARAGAAVLQLFDSYAGLLAPADFRRLALPATRRVVAGMQAAGVPVIYYANECHALVEAMADSGADVLGVDWRTDLAEARRRAGRPLALQGNLDPALLLGPAQRMAARARAILAGAGGPHVFNVGHGLLPDTPVAAARELVRAVRDGVKRET